MDARICTSGYYATGKLVPYLDSNRFSILRFQMLVKGVIFARMSPDEKAELVQRLQSLGYTVYVSVLRNESFADNCVI